MAESLIARYEGRRVESSERRFKMRRNVGGWVGGGASGGNNSWAEVKSRTNIGEQEKNAIPDIDRAKKRPIEHPPPAHTHPSILSVKLPRDEAREHGVVYARRYYTSTPMFSHGARFSPDESDPRAIFANTWGHLSQIIAELHG